ncbi:Rap1a/Tai family immunity protein [uncultured Roseobacter sp.]|uniref:Rap1a/Tai family immunity protein n=1 Tax=uncultured Roseobacter sp. TaxID=114847 RepID=UPI00262072CA|nr:Rap1a/Tai family immunity protein [uncultured Roseobacter sp.]
MKRAAQNSVKGFVLVATCYSITSISVAQADGWHSVENLKSSCEYSVSQNSLGHDQQTLAYMCLGYISGAVAVMAQNCASYAFDFAPSPQLAIGSFPNIEAARLSFLSWTVANPEQWERPALVGVVSALSAEFPCKGQ